MSFECSAGISCYSCLPKPPHYIYCERLDATGVTAKKPLQNLCTIKVQMPCFIYKMWFSSYSLSLPWLKACSNEISVNDLYISLNMYLLRNSGNTLPQIFVNIVAFLPLHKKCIMSSGFLCKLMFISCAW